MRKLTYAQAINEALTQAMELDDKVVVAGQLVDYKSGIFGTTTGLAERYGTQRVEDYPVAESLMTSAAIGQAVAGLRPVLVHQRLDFMFYSLDAIANWMSLWRFKSQGQSSLPVTIRVIVGKGWGQGAQHSKSIHAWFAHLPGLRVAVPATAYDCKGLILESIFGQDPTVIIEHRSLFSMSDEVPEMAYRVRFGQGVVRRPGQDITFAALGFMVPLALRAAGKLAQEGIDMEVIDLRTAYPLDQRLLLRSVNKTKRLVAGDYGWHTAGMAAEIMALVSENMGRKLLADPVRMTLPDSHTPMSAVLEEQYYPNEEDICKAVRRVMG
ncbi:MAG: transketolase C-terminal domain-containing protein [Thermodesulfobacteriota bacterium]